MSKGLCDTLEHICIVFNHKKIFNQTYQPTEKKTSESTLFCDQDRQKAQECTAFA